VTLNDESCAPNWCRIHENWGAWLSDEVFGDLADRIKYEPFLYWLLSQTDTFESALAELQYRSTRLESPIAQSAARGISKCAIAATSAMNTALAATTVSNFRTISQFRCKRSNEIRSHLFFESDLLAELHYLNDNLQHASDGDGMDGRCPERRDSGSKSFRQYTRSIRGGVPLPMGSFMSRRAKCSHSSSSMDR